MSFLPPTKSRREARVPLRKVRKFFQVSLPAQLSRKFGIAEGEYVEMQETDEGILVKPVTVTERVPIVRLNPREQELLISAKKKIAKINTHLATAQGLIEAEAKVAAKVGLIDTEQIWWWLESWQKGEREAEKDLKAGKVRKFDGVEDLLGDLRS